MLLGLPGLLAYPVCQLFLPIFTVIELHARSCRTETVVRIELMLVRLLIGEGNGTPLQYSCLENPMDGGAWWAAVHGVTKSRTRLSDFTFTFHFHALEEEMATHSSVPAWRIPGMAEPGGLPSMGSHRVTQLKRLSSSSSSRLLISGKPPGKLLSEFKAA